MGKSASLDAKLERLSALRDRLREPETMEVLRESLGDRSNHVVARAAQMAGEGRLTDLEADLAKAFFRFLENPAKTDKGCAAKTAIAKALAAMESVEREVFLRGVRHVQPEPVYGGTADTAAELRTLCGIALVQMNHPDALLEVTQLLADPEFRVRVAAARTLADSGRSEGELVLRLKVLTGDSEAEVITECLTALLSLAPKRSIKFVADRLDSDQPTVAEAAVMAMGTSRLPDALAPLRQRYEKNLNPELRKSLLLAMAMLRQPEATRFLLSLIAEGGRQEAIGAIEALAVFRSDPGLRQEVEAAAEARDERDIRDLMEQQWA